MNTLKAGLSVSTLVSRGLWFSLAWWVLTDGASSSWWVGAPAVLLALVASVGLLAPMRFNWFQFVRFVPFFLVRSLLGGVDVAWRVFHPGLPIAPGLVEYPLRLPSGLAQVVMLNTVSLLPGTLSAEISKNRLHVHVLDERKTLFPELDAVEQGVARMFGISLPEAGKVHDSIQKHPVRR